MSCDCEQGAAPKAWRVKATLVHLDMGPFEVPPKKAAADSDDDDWSDVLSTVAAVVADKLQRGSAAKEEAARRAEAERDEAVREGLDMLKRARETPDPGGEVPHGGDELERAYAEAFPDDKDAGYLAPEVKLARLMMRAHLNAQSDLSAREAAAQAPPVPPVPPADPSPDPEA